MAAVYAKQIWIMVLADDKHTDRFLVKIPGCKVDICPAVMKALSQCCDLLSDGVNGQTQIKQTETLHETL